MSAFSGLRPAQSTAAFGHTDEKPPLWGGDGEVSVVSFLAVVWDIQTEMRRTRTYQCTEDYCKGIYQRRALGEAPEEERGERATERAEEHHPGIRKAVGEVAEGDLADDGRGVKERENDSGCEWCRNFLCEGRDVQRDWEVGESLDEAGE